MLSLKLKQKHQALAFNSLLRSQEEIETTDGIHLRKGNEQYISFSTNNYLGLTHHPKVIAACQSALSKYGVGSGSAYLISGYSTPHRELEEHLADFLNYPRVLLFSSGYLANVGTISTLFFKQDTIFSDRLNHASIVDGCLASHAKFFRYPHIQTETLKNLCEQKCVENTLIVTEGLFGMDGTLAPLNIISDLAKKNKALLMVDDAHAIGVMGATGRGSLECHHLNASDVSILTGTLGKAFGSYGAFVASSHLIIESLIQSCRNYIYTTAIPPAIAAASLASLKLIQEEGWRRDKLFELIRYFKLGMEQLNIPCLNSDTPIQPIIMGSNERALAVSKTLLDKGLFIKAIRPPTVPRSSARLRISLTAEHTKAQLDQLLEALNYAIKYN